MKAEFEFDNIEVKVEKEGNNLIVTVKKDDEILDESSYELEEGVEDTEELTDELPTDSDDMESFSEFTMDEEEGEDETEVEDEVETEEETEETEEDEEIGETFQLESFSSFTKKFKK